MNITTLQERIAKANEKIEKKQNTIAKYHKTIEKQTNALVKKYNWNPEDRETHVATLQSRGFTEEQAWDISWTIYKIENAEEGIENNTKQIEETRKTIAKYEAQLAGELERESMYIREVPEAMKSLQSELVRVWDEYDAIRKEQMYKAYKELGYYEFFKEYTYADYEVAFKSTEELHKANERDAKMMIINLVNRVKDITGEVTSWDYITCTQGTHGMPVLNGKVIGKEGIARVESIGAGGWNIQRYHIRVLVHSI